MMTVRALLTASALSVLVPAAAAGQTPGLTVDDLVRLAFEHSPAIAARRAAVDRSVGLLGQAGARPNPIVTTERREEIGGMDTMSSVTAAWPLELWRRGARVAVATRQADVARADLEDAERRLAGSVRRQAVAVLADGQRLRLIDAQSTALQHTYELMKSRVDSGAAAPLFRDQAFVEWQRSEAARAGRRADVAASLAALKALVGLAADAPLTLAGDIETAFATEPVVAAEAGDRADVRRAAAAVTAAAAEVTEAQAGGRLDLSVFVAYARMREGFPQLGIGAGGSLEPIHGVFHNLSVGASVVLPLANRNRGATAAAIAGQRSAEFERDATRLAASAEVAAARARSDEAQRALAIYTTGLRGLARKNVEVVRESFMLGRLTLIDVLAEERRALDVEMGYVDALAAALRARADLLQALGVTR